jgi:hypothetical protein
MILLRNIPGGAGKEGRYDSFFAGLLGGYAVFGRQPGSISQQVSLISMICMVEDFNCGSTKAHENENLKIKTNCPDCDLRVRASHACSRQTRRSAQYAPALITHHTRVAYSDH